MKIKKGNKRITNVFYISDLKQILLSVDSCYREVLEILFKSDFCEMRDKNNLLNTKVKVTKNKK